MIHLFLPVWGEKNFNLLDQALGRCLRWPRNNKSVEESSWTIVTDREESVIRAANIIKTFVDKPTIHVLTTEHLNDPRTDKGVILLQALIPTIKRCIHEKTPMLMATPDFIYGDGTIEWLMQMAKEPGSCASIPNIRVKPSILKWLDIYGEAPPTNPELVRMAVDDMHISWAESMRDCDYNRSFRSGVSWEWLDDSTFSAQHVMPSPFLCNFIPQDLDYLQIPHDNRSPGFGAWDHKWPKFLIENGRLRFIGSSDAAVMVEVTDSDANVPPIEQGDARFYNRDAHNQIQKQYISIFRC